MNLQQTIRRILREQIDSKKTLSEGRLKQINVTDEILSYIENAFHQLKEDYGDKYDLDGYTFNAFEFDRYHEFCPYGFDMDVDIENKRIHMELCSQNEGLTMNRFRDVIYDELEAIFIGRVDFGGRKPFVKKTKYDKPISI